MNSVFFPLCIGIGMLGAALTYAIAGPAILLQAMMFVLLVVVGLLRLATDRTD